MSFFLKFGLCVVPLGVVLAVLPLLYQRTHEFTDYDYVEETSKCNKRLGDYKLRCLEIAGELKDLFNSHGVVVLRQVLPKELLEDLVEEVQCRFQPKAEKSRKWAIFARNLWMDSEVACLACFRRIFWHFSL